MAAPSLSAIGSRYFLKFSADWKARPPEMTILRGGQLGARRAWRVPRRRRRKARPPPVPSTVSIGAEPPVAGRLEGRGADGDDLLRVRALHGLDGVAGIDRPLERVGRDHLGDVGDLHHVEERRDPRHDVLAGGGRRRDERVVGRRRARRSAPPAARRADGRSRRRRRGAPWRRRRASPLPPRRRPQSLPATRTWTSPPSAARRSARGRWRP